MRRALSTTLRSSLALLLAACASGPEPEDVGRDEVTSCATGRWLEDVDRWEEAHAVCGEASEACTVRLREDFGIGDFDRVEYLLESFRFLVVWDLGAWPPVEGAYVHAESVAPFAD
ncbi:MAG: hypothetical protein V4850_28025 [Myxococcota bacterium]